jgi:apolipoprotein D and lipocalin family protein
MTRWRVSPRYSLPLIVLGALTIAGCATDKPVAPEPNKPIDTSRFFTGRWYEIGRTPMRLTDGCVAGTTDYSHAPTGDVIDRDVCRTDTPEGKEKVFQGPVTILNPGTNTKMTVRYTVWGFVPVSRTYWILDHSDDYQWFIVSDPAFENVGILARLPRPTTTEVEALKAHTRALGYDTNKLEFPTEFPAGKGEAKGTSKG